MTRAVIPAARRANTGLRPLWRMWEDIDEEVQRELDACHTLLISRSQALETGDPAIISEVRVRPRARVCLPTIGMHACVVPRCRLHSIQ